MSALVARRSGVSPEEYFRLDAGAPVRSEWLRGEMYATAGGTIDHSLICANCVGALHNVLRGRPCRVFEGNLRVKSGGPTLYSYPDATVICGQPMIAPEDRNTVTNPTVVVEVLSPSTAAYDLGTKFDCYRELVSLRNYLAVSSREYRVQSFFRRDDGIWEVGFAAGRAASIHLPSINAQLPLAEIYEGVEFPLPDLPPAARDEDLRNVV